MITIHDSPPRTVTLILAGSWAWVPEGSSVAIQTRGTKVYRSLPKLG